MESEISRIKDIDFSQQAEVLRRFISKTEAKEIHILLGSFMFLAADIIKADGEIKLIEIQRVNDLLGKILKEDEAKGASAVLQEYLSAKDATYELNWQDDLIRHCENLKIALPEEVLLHVLAFLHDLIKVDGVVDACEMVALMGLSQMMGINLSNN